MAIDITNHKCPACTGPLHYAGASGMLECDYCGSKFTVDEIEKLYAEEEAKAAENTAKNEEKEEISGNQWSSEETKKMKVYSCPSYGVAQSQTRLKRLSSSSSSRSSISLRVF